MKTAGIGGGLKASWFKSKVGYPNKNSREEKEELSDSGWEGGRQRVLVKSRSENEAEAKKLSRARSHDHQRLFTSCLVSTDWKPWKPFEANCIKYIS